MKQNITGILAALFFSLPLMAENHNEMPVDSEASEKTEESSQDKPKLYKLVPEMQPPDIQCILDAGVLKVAIYDGHAPPFFLKNTKGERVGIDVNIANELAKELGVKTEFIPAPTFDSVVELVKEGKANVGISKLSVTLERAKSVQYTGRYVNMGKALMINRVQLERFGNTRKDSIEKIFSHPDAKIAVIDDSSFERFAKRIFPKTKIVTYPTWTDVIDAVLEGKVLAAFRDEWEIRKFIDVKPDAPIIVQAVIIKDEVDPIEMIVHWNSSQLAHFINKFVEINNYKYDVKALFNEYKTYKKEIGF